MNRRKNTDDGVRLGGRPDITWENLEIDPDKRVEFQAKVRKGAEDAVAALPAKVASLRRLLRKYSPLSILATFTAYGLTSFVGPKGVSSKRPLNILPHQAELLQAIILSLPLGEWGSDPVDGSVMQQVFDAVPEIADTFFQQRVLAGSKLADPSEIVIASLLERIRMHTHGVRNWGYHRDVVRISKDLYGSLDDRFSSKCGFSCSAIIDVMDAMVTEYEKRANDHWELLGRVLKGRTPRQIFDLYFDQRPEMTGSSEEFAAALPFITDRDAAASIVMSHYDLSHISEATFHPAEIASLTGLPEEVARAVLSLVSRNVDDVITSPDEHLFLANPVWDSPGIKIADSFVFVMPQSFFSHIHRIMERLASDVGIKDSLERARATYLERELDKTLRRAFPNARVTSGAKWPIGNQVFETDSLVVIDRTVLVAEAKAHRLSAQGLRGAPERVKKHVEDMVLKPSLQSARLAEVIERASAGDAEATAVVEGLGIDPNAVDQVIRISVTLDDFSVLSTSVAEFKDIGWVPKEHVLAPTILLADLLCVVDILDTPLRALHYLSERVHLQDSFNLLGDELDLLGLYLETGFNLGKPPKDTMLSTDGLSKPIDKYYTSRDAGVLLPKPSLKMSPHFRQVVAGLEQQRPDGWTTAGLHLLSAASPSEQREIETALIKLRKKVRKNFRDPRHINSLQIQPPLSRKARVGFFLFPKELAKECRSTMTTLLENARRDDGAAAMVLFARSIDNLSSPFEVFEIARAA
ncbi:MULTISPECIES: hypothetical protein [unclassified Rhizobium]|uniref:hypothetical protein n=1 Tax=unclassified Rhizobium TaxID=2613769 RepID=UPI0025D57617|nr:hypothetical protein [Rhizobium sp. UBA1881]